MSFCCSDSDIPHVMISYHWGSQKTMICVKDRLRTAGYKVWMDVDNMSKNCFHVDFLPTSQDSEQANGFILCLPLLLSWIQLRQ